jgi:cell division protein FtsI/penicillin-binding protein 2
MRPRRRYALGPAAGHVLGYVGEITAVGARVSPAFSGERYEQGMIVGKTGIERAVREPASRDGPA